MIKGTAFLAAAIVAGFGIGFLWGRGTRSALSESTSTSFDNGDLTVRVRVGQALGAGLGDLFR